MAHDRSLEGIKLFSGLSTLERKRAASLITPLRIKEGHVFTREGSPGREFLIISEGSVLVSRGGLEVARLSPGDFFGEIALVAGIPRTATVTAITDMVVNALNPREFTSLLDTSAALAKKILVRAMRRLAELKAPNCRCQRASDAI